MRGNDYILIGLVAVYGIIVLAVSISTFMRYYRISMDRINELKNENNVKKKNRRKN